MVLRVFVLILLSAAAFGVGGYFGFTYVKSAFLMKCMHDSRHINPGPCEAWFNDMMVEWEPFKKSRELDEFAKKIRERNKKLQRVDNLHNEG